ncbi:MAG: hypothetical protein ACOVME_11795 [Rhodobacter sp.]
MPLNAFTPIAAHLALTGRGRPPILADFDWRQEGPQFRDIAAQAGPNRLKLRMGGARLAIDGAGGGRGGRTGIP